MTTSQILHIIILITTSIFIFSKLMICVIGDFNGKYEDINYKQSYWDIIYAISLIVIFEMCI